LEETVTVTSCSDIRTAAGTGGPETEAVPGRAWWRRQAACRHVDTELFFPVGRGSRAMAETQQAKAICARCPVRQPCLAYALATGQAYGIWGGYDEEQRRVLHRQRRESAGGSSAEHQAG
jgi:WhiB family transcriptional regulator, redox-sensing transcriptional regulator